MAERTEKRVLTENFISIALTQIISYIIPLITLPYLSRTLGVEKFGLVYWAQAFIGYFIILTEFGFNQSAVREIAINRDDKDKVNEIFNSVMLIKVGFIILSFIILSCLIFIIPKLRQEWILFYFTFFMVIGTTIYPIWYYQAIEHMKYITFLNIMARTIFLILIFIFIKQPSDYLYVALLNSAGSLLAGFVGIVIAIKRFNLKFLIPSWQSVVSQFKYSSEFFLSRVSVTAYTNTSTFVLGLIGSPAQVAFFTSAERIYYALKGLCEPFVQTLYPHVAKDQSLKTYKKIFKLAMILLAGLEIFMFVFAKDIITIFYGADMLSAYKVLRIFCLTMLFSFPSALIGYPVVAALGHTKEANFSIVYASIIHIICLLSLLFLGQANIYIIALLTALAEGLIVTYRIWTIWKYKLWSK